MSEATQHSAPRLQARINEYEMLLRHNITLTGIHRDHVHVQGKLLSEGDPGFHDQISKLHHIKDFVITQAEKLVDKEF